MKIAVVLTIATLLSYVTAYSTPGAYERMWLYYAYLGDCQLIAGKPGKTTHIASGCPKVMGTGGSPCSFNQFIAYIERRKEPYSFTDDVKPDVETMAKTLEKAGVTTAYSPVRVLDGVGKEEFARLFEDLGEYLSTTVLFAVDDSIKTPIRNAASGVARARIAATTDAVESAFGDEKVNINPVWKEIPLFKGSSEKVKVLDAGKTQSR
ncbi:hypothetical protein MBLNU459_g7341t1 [Dothideomycetes sp. NU459]